MRRTILTLAAVLATTAAHAQTWEPNTSYHSRIVDPEAGLPLYKRTMMPPDGYIPPPDQQMAAWTVGPLPIVRPTSPDPVVMYGGKGGLIVAHQDQFELLKRNGAKVEMRGGCWSACTLITGYIPKDRLCFGAGSFLAFHSAL